MSLLVDPNYLLQQLRLDFLAKVADPFGPGTITFPDEAAPYVSLAQLDDPDLWPELREVRSPEPFASGFAGPSARRRSGRGLQHTETIGGPGGAGMRVDGRLRTGSKKRNSRQTEAHSDSDTGTQKATRRASRRSRHAPDNAGQWAAAGQILGDDAGTEEDEGFIDVKGKGKAVELENKYEDDEDEAEDEAEEGDDVPDPLSPFPDDEPPRGFQAIGGRPTQRRMGSFFGSPQNPPLVKIDAPLDSPGKTSTDGAAEMHSPARSGSDDDDDVALPPVRKPPTLTIAGSFSHDQELSEALRLNDGAVDADPVAMLHETLTTSDDADTAPLRPQGITRTTTNVTEQESWSALSNGPPTASSAEDDFSFVNRGLSKPAPSASALPAVAEKEEEAPKEEAPRMTLAPPAGFRPRERRRVNISLRAPLQVPNLRPVVVEDGEKTSRPGSPTRRTSSQRARARTTSSEKQVPPSQSLRTKAVSGASVAVSGSVATNSVDGSGRRPRPSRNVLESFPIHKMAVQKRAAGPSGLSSLLATAVGPQAHNPYTEMYGALASRASDAVKLNLFFPHSKEPSKKLVISVRRDLTVEEVIGFGLWSYWEVKREPRLGPEDAKSISGKMDPAHWNLMMAEDDGEVDDDFPALDRLQPISKVGTTEFGVVEATEAQAAENRVVLQGIVRRPSRVVAPMSRATTGASLPGSQKAQPVGQSSPELLAGSLVETMNAPRPSGVPMGEPDVLLRIRIPAAATGNSVVVTAVKVPSAMYLQDVLELVCRKRSEYLKDHRDYALLLGNQDIVVPLDRTVESLQGMNSLRLVRRAQYAHLLATATKSPNLSNTNPNAPIMKRLSEPMGPKYVTAVDVMAPYKEWVVSRKHAMSLTRHDRLFVVDGEYVTIRSMSTGRTSSYHVSNIVECKPSRRLANSFKFTVLLDTKVLKRFDFDANSKEAVEDIVASVRQMSANFKASRAKVR